MLYRKLCWMALVAMATTLLLYPILHESGHSLMAVALGGEVVEMRVLPLPYAAVRLDHPGALTPPAIGVAGLLFPVLFSLQNPHKFTLCIVVYTLRLVNAIAFLWGCGALLLHRLGFSPDNGDVLTAVPLGRPGMVGMFILCAAGFVLCACLLLKARPAQHLLSFFWIKN